MFADFIHDTHEDDVGILNVASCGNGHLPRNTDTCADHNKRSLFSGAHTSYTVFDTVVFPTIK